jgi:hypothetical protein
MALILPPSHQIHNRKPTRFCTLCGAAFFETEMRAYLKHCAGHSLEDVRAQSPTYQAPGIFSKDAGDREWGEYIDRKMAEDPHGWAKWLKTSDGKHSSGIGDG